MLWVTSPFIEIDRQHGDCREMVNPCPTRQDLYRLADLDWVCETFKDNLVLEIMLAHAGSGAPNPLIRYNQIEELGKPLGIVTAEDTVKNVSRTASEVHTRCALKASEYVIAKVEEFAKNSGKQVLYVLFPRFKNVAMASDTGTGLTGLSWISSLAGS